MDTILSILEAMFGSEQINPDRSRLLTFSRQDIARAASNLAGVQHEIRSFPERANRYFQMDDMLLFEDVMEAMLDVLSRQTRLDLFSNWLAAFERAYEIGTVLPLVEWFAEMEEQSGLREHEMVSIAKFWTNTSAVRERFQFLKGECCHGRYSGPPCLEENTFCTTTVYGGMVHYVTRVQSGYFRGERYDYTLPARYR